MEEDFQTTTHYQTLFLPLSNQSMLDKYSYHVVGFPTTEMVRLSNYDPLPDIVSTAEQPVNVGQL